MDKFIPILIVIAIYFFKFYNNYKEEQKKNSRRSIPQNYNSPEQAKDIHYDRPTSYDSRSRRNSGTGNRNIPSERPQPTRRHTDQPVNVNQTIDRRDREITHTPLKRHDHKEAYIRTQLPKIDLEIIELEDSHSEVSNQSKKLQFDLKDAVIKSAILNRLQI